MKLGMSRIKVINNKRNSEILRKLVVKSAKDVVRNQYEKTSEIDRNELGTATAPY